MIRFLSIALVVATCAGCSQRVPVQTSDFEHGDYVERNATTKAMVGRWGTNGEVGLIVAETDGRIVFSAPKNDTWRMEISDAKIVDDSVHFTQKNYLHSGESHPFNGVACNSIAKMADANTLELGITTKDVPEYGADMLKRIE